MGGSADSEGTAGVMLNIITSVTHHTENLHWPVEPIIIHLYTWFTVCVSCQVWPRCCALHDWTPALKSPASKICIFCPTQAGFESPEPYGCVCDVSNVGSAVGTPGSSPLSVARQSLVTHNPHSGHWPQQNDTCERWWVEVSLLLFSIQWSLIKIIIKIFSKKKICKIFMFLSIYIV